MNIDTLLTAAPEGASINIPPGLHTISGLAQLKKGQTLVGSASSVIRLMHNRNADVTALYSKADNVTVENLTLDLNCFGVLVNTNFKVNGIYLEGNNCIVSNVTVINGYGTKLYNREAFMILCIGDNASIFSCHVTQVRGDYVSAITCTSGQVSLNRVEFPETRPVGRTNFGDVAFYAYNFGGQNADGTYKKTDVEITGNTAINATVGVYHDTGNVDRAVITDNILHNCDIGLWVNKTVELTSKPSYAKNILFKGNACGLGPLAPKPYVAVSLSCSNNTGVVSRNNENLIKDVKIQNNTIFYASNGPRPASDMKFIALTTDLPSTDATGIAYVQIDDNLTEDGVEWGYRNKGNNAIAVTVRLTPKINWITA